MKRLRLNGPLVLAGVLLTALLVVLILPWVMDVRDPQLAQLQIWLGNKVKLPPFAPGEYGFLLGTDNVGRDLFARLVYGARTTLAIALVINLLRALVGIPLGLVAGWRGGWLSGLTQALASGFGALPTLVLTMLILFGFRRIGASPDMWPYIYSAVVVVAGIPRMAEHVRLRTAEIARKPHIEAAIATGATAGRILRRHVVPVMSADLMVMLAAEMAWVLLMMGQLAVFGLFVGGTVILVRDGLPPIIVEYLPEWAQMLGANQNLIRARSIIPLLPGVALGLTAVCFHLLAEGLRLRSLRRR